MKRVFFAAAAVMITFLAVMLARYARLWANTTQRGRRTTSELRVGIRRFDYYGQVDDCRWRVWTST